MGGETVKKTRATKIKADIDLRLNKERPACDFTLN